MNTCRAMTAATLALMTTLLAPAARAAGEDVEPARLLLAQAGAAASAAAADSERYGSLATGMPYDREVRLGTGARSIGVWRLETIRFVAADGREFRWRFDGLAALDSFPLARIAPAGFPFPGGTTISLNGEIPVAP